jgi:hypothetical protein
LALNAKKYSAGAVKHLFWFDEFRIFVALLGEGKTLAEVKALSVSRNIFSAPTTQRSAQIFNTVSARIITLDADFFTLFEDSDLQTQKLITLIAALRYDHLFFTFTRELYAERLASGHDAVSDKEISTFFIEIQREDDTAAAWTDATLKKLAVTYKSMLADAGLFERAQRERKLIRQLPDDRLERLLKDKGMADILHVLTGERV